MELFSLLRSVTPKTGTQIQTAKAENDIFMIMFYEHVTRCNKNNKSRPVGSWDFFLFSLFLPLREFSHICWLRNGND